MWPLQLKMIFKIEDNMSNPISLRKLGKGQKAVITSIAAQGELGRRIRDMGLVPGAEVAVVGRAPLKDPVALRVKDFTLSLRNNEADFIEVEILPGA
jgi:ferrous iron transport protein A